VAITEEAKMGRRSLAISVILALLGSNALVMKVKAAEQERTLDGGAPVVVQEPLIGEVTRFPPGAEGTEAAGEPAGGHRVGNWLRKYKLACWSHHNSPGCGNLKAECTFIFGSCRAFYGEGCQPPPPRTASGPGTQAGNKCGCP
jgi:hypothetical protein